MDNERQKKFKYYFVGLILFILAVIFVLLSTGRGALA